MTQPAALTEHRPSVATSALKFELPDLSLGALPDIPEFNEPGGHPWVVRPALLFERLQQAVNGGSASLALLIVDLDGFHSINQAHGFAAGDRFLEAVGERLAGRLRANDLVTRLGADEFAVLLFDVPDAASAVAVARDVLAGLRGPLPLDDRLYAASARAGLAMGCANADVRALLDAARAALHGAKETGLDVAVARHGQGGVWPTAMTNEADGGDGIPLTGREVRDGLLRGEFKVHYQPIHNFGSGRVDTLEALVRWRHPTRGLLAPGSFLPAAERSGLAQIISVRVLDCACDSLRRWRRNGHGELRVAVNLSAQDFLPNDFAGTVASTLERHALPIVGVVKHVSDGLRDRL